MTGGESAVIKEQETFTKLLQKIYNKSFKKEKKKHSSIFTLNTILRVSCVPQGLNLTQDVFFGMTPSHCSALSLL